MNGQSPNNGMNNQNGMNGSVLGTANTNPVGPTPVPNTAQPLGGNTLGPAPQVVNPSPVPNQAPNVTPNPSAVPNPNNGGVNPPAQPLNNPNSDMNSGINGTPNSSANPAGPTNPQGPTAPMGAPSPMAQPIPGTEGTPGINPVGMGMPLGANPPKNESIGTIPPTNTPQSKEKKKQPMNKVIFILLIVALIALVAYGVYYFLNLSSTKVKLTPKTVNIGVGEALSDRISDYATVEKGNVANCKLNNRNIVTSEIGEYEYTITCDKDTYKGKVVVSDKTAPTVSLKPVYRTVNDTVKVEDFVVTCTDPSNCTTKFANEGTVNGYLSTAGGPYKVDILAEDTAGNSATYEGKLYVTEYSIMAFTNCSSAKSNVTGFQATKVATDILPIGRNDSNIIFLGSARREYKYEFTSESEYTEAIGNKEQTITFDNVTGDATYDDEKHTLTITTDLTTDTLNSENNGTFPTTYPEFSTLYISKGYTCSNMGAQ